MFNAKQAREHSEAGKVQTIKKDLEKLIKNAVSKGKTQIHKTGMMPKELITELKEAGYNVDEQATGAKISW